MKTKHRAPLRQTRCSDSGCCPPEHDDIVVSLTCSKGHGERARYRYISGANIYIAGPAVDSCRTCGEPRNYRQVRALLDTELARLGLTDGEEGLGTTEAEEERFCLDCGVSAAPDESVLCPFEDGVLCSADCLLDHLAAVLSERENPDGTVREGHARQLWRILRAARELRRVAGEVQL